MPNASPREELWTPANVVTLLRICGIPLFVIAIISPWPQWFPQWSDAEIWKPWVAAGVFILLSATDALDGYLARSRGEVTNLGKFMDPLADKILVAAALLALIELGVLPSWVALIILAREFIVSGIRMVAASQGFVIAASWYGKAKTVAQIVAVVLFIVKDSHTLATLGDVMDDRLYLFSWFVMIVALILTVVSMLDYFVKAKELFGFGAHPDAASSDAKPGLQASADESPTPASPCTANALAEKVVAAARSSRRKIGTAESCTGGLIAAALTAIPGSSDVVEGGIVSYSNTVKESRLGVRRSTLSRHGAVSRETACEMANGARAALGVDVAVSVTGIAGPGGGEPGKPVGTVWFALSDENITVACLSRFEGDRAQVREQTVLQALTMLLDELTGEPLSAHPEA